MPSKRKLLSLFSIFTVILLYSVFTVIFQYRQHQKLIELTKPYSQDEEVTEVFDAPSYVVCNGLSNQLLGHAGQISYAIKSGSDIFIPDVFIVNGVQTSDENVLPTRENAIPLSKIIDVYALLKTIQSYGVKARMVTFGNVFVQSKNVPHSCDWLATLQKSNPQITFEVLRAMKPSPSFSHLITTNLSMLPNPSSGICLHHRNGPDWIEHCKRWESLKGGWRKNCLNDRQMPLHNLVASRIPAKSTKSWIYYIGDEEPSDQMIKDFEGIGMNIIHRKRDKTLPYSKIAKIMQEKKISLETHRELFAAIDFFTCAEIESFIGNSVSTFSANQIALRGGMKLSWYNSRSIPLAEMFHVFYIPFVYTYTERSQPGSNLLLKASILSVRKTFGMIADIHILYHGFEDELFRNWLRVQSVIIHNHIPTWLDAIEEMRKNGNISKSHLLEHRGNYIGTWQRIDIPLFINAEYCIYLDYDTIVKSTFTIDSFGLDITPIIAISSEVESYNRPQNLGVALLNVPMLRETYDDFKNYITSHTHSAIFAGIISDQGAYLDYYRPSMRFLAKIFNVKPYWKEKKNYAEVKIVHFHGLKPNDILKIWMGKPDKDFPAATRFLVRDLRRSPNLACQAMYDFSHSIVQDVEILKKYCGTLNLDINVCIRFYVDLATEEKIQNCTKYLH